MNDLETARALADAAEKAADGATQGPWMQDGPLSAITVWSDNENRVCFLTSDGNPGGNARFIVASRQIVPDAAATIRALVAEVERLRGPMRVKPLVWENSDHEEWRRISAGDYDIWIYGADHFTVEGICDDPLMYRSLEAAKAAAEADHQSRILAWLEPDDRVANSAAGLLPEARGKLHDIMCLPDGASIEVARKWAADVRGMLIRLVKAMEETAAEALQREIPDGYGPEGDVEFQRGYDAALERVRNALAAMKEPG